jgi:uncharacterized protein YndB with AHSA1/START domain
MTDDVISRTRVVPAPPEEVFELLADPQKHQLIDGSSMVRGVIEGPIRLSQGATFGMKMQKGPVPYKIKNTVEEFEEGRLIAWRHAGKHRWRYQLEPTEGGTKVTESFDTSTVPAPMRPITKLLGKANGDNIDKTLDRLVQHFS